MKYRIVIDFETDKKLEFPVDAQLLTDMQVQLESLEDGTYDDLLSGSKVIATVLDSKVIEDPKDEQPCNHIFEGDEDCETCAGKGCFYCVK